VPTVDAISPKATEAEPSINVLQFSPKPPDAA
jgi:hypothetical protein